MPDPRQKLYNALSSKFDLGTFDEFNSKMDNPESRKKLYSSVSSNFDLGSYDEFESKIAPLKKKDGTKSNSTSTSVSQKQDSVQKSGSSGSQEFEYKPVYDERGREVKIKNEKGELVPYMEKVPKGFASSTEEREIVRQEQKQKASKPIVTSSNLKKYQEATKVSDEEKATLQQEVSDEFDKKGFWNGIADGAKRGFNFLADTFTTIGTFGTETEASKNFKMQTDSFAKEKKQAEQELIASKQPVTPETIAEKAKEIKLNKKLEGLVVDKNNKFLSELSPEEIKSLNLERVKQYKTLSDKDKYIATQAEILKNNFEKDTKDYTTAVAIIQKNKEQGIETNQALIDFAIEKENSLKEKFNEVKNLEAEYISNKENIGSAEEEIDFLKRNYDTADKVKTLAKIGFGDIYNSIANKLPLMVSDLDQAIFEPLRPGSSEGVLSDDERQELIDKSIDWETAKELAKSNVKKDVDFENLSLSNFGQFFAQELGTQIPVFAQMAMPGGVVSIGMTSAFEKYGRMEQESNNISFEFNGKQFTGFEKENGEIVDSLGNTYDPKEVNITSIREADKSTANKFFTSVTFGTAEAVLGAMPTKNIFGRALNSLSTSGERTLFRQSVKEFVKAKGTGVLNDTATEVVSEGATQIIQNIADISSGKKDVSIYDGVDHAMVSAGMLSFLMSATPSVAGLALKPFSESKENKQVNENLQEIFALQSQLNNTELSSISRTTIENKIKELEKSNSEVLDKIASRTKGISKETFDAIKDVNKKQELLILQASEISKDNSLDTEIKKKIIADLESEFNALETKRNKLASGKSTILDALSDNESARLKEKAANLLVNEEKAKGKTDEEINFTEEQINKKAIEIYNQNAVQQEATTTETQQEAQPQAEVQKTEQEVLENPIEEIERKRQNEINSISEIKKEKGLFGAILNKMSLGNFEWKNYMNGDVEVANTKEEAIQQINEKYDNLLGKIKENETAPSQVDNVDGNVQPGNNVVEPNGTTEQENNQAGDVQPTDNSRNVEVKREIRIADKGQVYTVEKTDLGLVITDKKGKKPSKVTERKILDEYSKTINFTQGQRVDESFESSAETYIDDIAEKSKNASEIAEAIAYVENADMNEGKVDPIQVAIARALGEKSVEKSSFTNINDRNNINQSIALQYFAPSGKGKGLDQIAMEVEYEIYGDYNANNPRISEEDIANFMVDNPRGAVDFLNRNRNEALEKLRTAFTDITGLPAKPQFVQKAIDQQIELKNQLFLGNSLYALSEEDLLSLDNDYQQFKQFENNEQQQEAINETPEARVDIKNTAQRGKESRVQETRGTKASGKSNESGSGSKSSMVEGRARNEAIYRTTEASNSGGSTGAILSIEEQEVTPEEKPSLLDEKIEKDKLSDVLDWLDGLKLDPNDLKATLPFLPQSWNMFIEAVKLAVKAGKTINDAIQEAIKKLQSEGIGNDEINAIVEKFTGQATKKVESGTFERKAGKKSLLSRVYEGENNGPLNSIIEDIGLDYKVENQEQAQNRAKKFVKQVGINKALEAVRNNLIKGAEKAFVYAEILDQIVELSESANVDEIGKIQEDYNVILEESLNAFDEEARDAGRFISALNRIYNNSRVRYNLTKQINQYKALNKGVIDEETLIKFNEADRKLKEIEQKLKEAEAKLIEQEQQLAIKNIEEAIAREIKNKVSNKTKATKIANQIRRAKIQKPDVFNASTGASLVWDGAVEIVAKSIEAGGTIADAVYKGVEYIKNTDWYKNATKDTQKKAIDSFIERMVSDSVEQTSSISISEDGKIRIPESVVKDYVRQGITDINEISQRIIDDFFSGNEDVTIREVRDAITRYGKTINQSKDEINAKVRELKRIGKLISAMEDVLEGKRPLKSGLQRDKPTQVEREMMRELKDKMRDLPLDEADLETAWKNALDTYKQRLKNQIEDLEKQIDNKEKSKVKRESVKLDEEAKALKEQVKVLRETLNNLVGKPELTEEQKINRATRQLENAIDNLTNQIANGELDYKDKPTPVNSARLTELRKQKDALNKQLQKAREESGIVEKRRLKQAKQRLKNQIELYQKKIQNKDFSKKEPKPLPADIELQQLQAEKIKWQEVYDKAKYEAELRDRKWQDYARELLVGIIGLPRLLMAGGEMSMVFIQGGIQTLSLATRNPKALAKIFAKAFISIGSNEKFLEYERAIKSDSNYMLMKNSKLALTETDYQMELREETFIGSNIVYGTWNAIGKGIEIGAVKILGKKDFPTIGSAFISMIKKDIETKKIPISEQFKNLNPLLAFERGNTIYMNEIRKARFMDGVKMLKMEGKNENDHKEDFKTLARAINTLTGRTSIGRLENINDYLGIIFFSFKNTISVFQQLNPWFYSYVLRNNYDEWTKPSVAQKIAVRDMVNFVTITTSMMFLLQAAAGDDEEGNPIVEIEKDPRSSDFMTLKIKGKDKDTRFDPWHGMKPQVVLFARLITGEQKRFKKGKVEIKRIGEGYKADTHWDNITKAYVYNKFSPSMQMAYKQMDSEVDKQGNKTYYGKDFQERFSLTPMYIESLREIEKQDPDGFTRFLAALGFFGLNSSTY